MAEKLTPANKPVPKSDGIPMGQSHQTLTTPNPVFGRYYGPAKPAGEVKGKTSMMGKDK